MKMQERESVSGVLLDESGLDLDQLARAADVEPEWVVRHVQAGVLGSETAVQVTSLRFRSRDLDRARRLASLERQFDANEQLAALVIDLGDELRRLRRRLRILGIE
jgi:chaperone modulatory protein CbpM